MDYEIIKKPLITEKSSMERASNKYFFKVRRNVNKEEIKKAIQKVFNVKVASVNVMNVKGKKRQYGKISGQTKSWKKAVVTLQAGQSIEALSA